MISYTSIPAICIMAVVSAALISMHILSVFAKEKTARIALFINIAFHILLVIPAMLITDDVGTPIGLEIVALAYMVSLFIYVVLYFTAERIAAHRERIANSSNDKEAAKDDL